MDQSGLDEIERDRELMRAEAFRLSDDLIQRQLRYASRSWTPPAQGGTRRADDGEGDDSPDSALRTTGPPPPPGGALRIGRRRTVTPRSRCAYAVLDQLGSKPDGKGASMKERLIGDDQLLVTADTTMGDPLWDWVAADAARRAPDGWRIANIGAVATTPAPVNPAYGYAAPAQTGVSLWILYRR